MIRWDCVCGKEMCKCLCFHVNFNPFVWLSINMSDGRDTDGCHF